MSGLSGQRLAEIAARVAAATEGPWSTDEAELVEIYRGTLPDITWVGYAGAADGAFIAAARTDVPELVAEVTRLTALVAEMHAASVGTVRKPLLGLVEDVAETRTQYLAQQSRADTLDVFLRRSQASAAEPDAELARLRQAVSEWSVRCRGAEADLAALRVRVAEVEARASAGPSHVWFLAEYDGAEGGPTLHATLASALAWDAEWASADSSWDWIERDGVHEQWAVDPDSDRPVSRGAGTVTPLTVLPVGEPA